MNVATRRGNGFWSAEGPLASLACAGLVVMASGRLAYAIAVGLAVVFVYLCVVACTSAGRRIVPDRMRGAVSVVLSSCFAAVYLLLLSLLSPLFAQEVAFFVSLAPVVFIASGMADRCAVDSLADGILRAGKESASVLALLVAFSLIREPIGYGDLSLPAKDGLILIFGAADTPAFAARTVAGTVGGFILFAYVLAAYRKIRSLRRDADGDKEEA